MTRRTVAFNTTLPNVREGIGKPVAGTNRRHHQSVDVLDAVCVIETLRNRSWVPAPMNRPDVYKNNDSPALCKRVRPDKDGQVNVCHVQRVHAIVVVICADGIFHYRRYSLLCGTNCHRPQDTGCTLKPELMGNRDRVGRHGRDITG